jgi:ubiquinone/menaquinone biosynthesis C-methylase UbiE
MTDSVRVLADHYSGSAGAYQRLWAEVIKPVSRQLVGRLPLAGAGLVLDVGAGVGTLLPLLQETAVRATVVGMDRSVGMIGRAPTAFPRVVGDAASLPFADGAVDVAVLAFMIFHLPDPVAGLRAVRRVLTKNGTVGVATWGPETSVPAIEIWHDELDRHGAPPDTPLVTNHEQVNTPDKLAGLLRDVGFTGVTTESVPWEFRPAPERFVEQHIRLGHTSRRLAGLPPEAQEEFVRAIRRRLGTLGPEGFVHERLTVIGIATNG